MRRTAVLVGLAVFFVTAAWWFFLISPRNADISTLETDRNVAIDTEQRLRVQIRQLEEIRDAEVQYLAALGTLEGLIPERPLLEEFIEQVYGLANDTGVELQTLAPALPAQAADGSELREIAVSVQVEGQFFEVLGFMFGLSDMERLVRIDAVSASSSEDETGGTILAASLELRLFTLADLLPILDDVTTAEDGTGDGDGTETDDGSDPGFEAAGEAGSGS
jgi:Tfp pilus assembly protein PilO